MTQQEAVAYLRDCDHLFLKPETVKKLTKAFGFEGSTYLAKADPPGTFKGLTLAGGAKEARGQDADQVACEICKHLKLAPPFMHGRGSQLRTACDPIEEHLKKVAVS